MGTISNASVSYGLRATGSPSKINVEGSSTIGLPSSTVPLNGDIAYSFRMTATGSGDDAVFNLEDYSITNTTGTPTFTMTDGTDFEGVAIPDTVTLFAILVSAPSTNVGKIYYEEPTGWDGKSTAGSQYISNHIVISGRPMESSLNNFALTIAEPGDYLEVTVVASST